MRHGNTGKEMVATGAWALVGKKHYKHYDGTEIKYDCNKWVWRVNGANGYSALWIALMEAEALMAKAAA